MNLSKAFNRLQPYTLVNGGHCFIVKITSLVAEFLQNRLQTVRNGLTQSSSYIPSMVGKLKGSKQGPILWLIYGNDLKVPGFMSHVKYADHRYFHTAVSENKPFFVVRLVMMVVMLGSLKNACRNLILK